MPRRWQERIDATRDCEGLGTIGHEVGPIVADSPTRAQERQDRGVIGDPPARTPRTRLSALLITGWFDVVLAGALAVLSVSLGGFQGAGWVVLLDLAAAILAGLTMRWPVRAGIALCLLMISYLFLPDNAATMGEYAPLIPILGTGVRGQRRHRAWMSAGFGVALAALTYRDYSAGPQFVLGLLVWGVLIAVLWLIGNMFTAYRRAHLDAAAYAVLQERLGLARDLHDTTARTLARVLLDAQRAAASGGGGPALDEAIVGVQQASQELRRSMGLLRAAEPLASPGSGDPLITASEEARSHLEKHGFPTTVTVDGGIARLPTPVRDALSAALGEAVANIERHGLVGMHCAISTRVDHKQAKLVVMNEVGEQRQEPELERLGLVGVTERLSPLGGTLEVEEEGTTWLTRITVPFAPRP